MEKDEEVIQHCSECNLYDVCIFEAIVRFVLVALLYLIFKTGDFLQVARPFITFQDLRVYKY